MDFIDAVGKSFVYLIVSRPREILAAQFLVKGTPWILFNSFNSILTMLTASTHNLSRLMASSEYDME